jgi:HAMP domain-containing protein
MGIRSKIMYGFLTLAAMLSLAGIISIVEFRNMGQSVEKLLDENYLSIASSQRMTESIEKCNNGILLILIGKFDEGRAIIDKADSVFISNLKIAKSHINQPGEDSLVTSIDTLFLSYRKLWLRPLTGELYESKLDWYFHIANKSFTTLVQKIEYLSEMKSQSIYTTTASLKNKAKRAVMPGIVAIIAALVFSVIFNYFINYYFVSPIIKISKGVNDYSAYGIPFKVNIETNDELLDLKDSVENMVNKTRLEKL